MQLRNIILMLSLTLSVIACTTPRQQASVAPAADNQEYVLRGFSLSIPASEGWNVAKQGPLNIVLAKQDKEKDERYAIQALVVELPNFKSDDEFLEYIESRMNTKSDKSASKVIEVKSRLVAGQGEMCVQSHRKEENSTGAGKTENTKQSILELVNFTCRYPDKKNAGIYLAYSKRSTTASTDENLTAQANKLFSKMNFRDL